MALRLPETRWKALGGMGGRPTVLGLRPEHIVPIGGGADKPEQQAAVAATVDLVEPFGAEVHARLRLETGIELVSRASGREPFPLAGAVTVILDLGNSHFFDAATGRRIGV
jgi:multiple sugar transport system ATP-binding protein